MKFDVIITTYNRNDIVQRLIEQIGYLKTQPDQLIVVDSSDTENNQLKNDTRVTYVRSSIANQPYQRYVGFKISRSPILIYLDDDMEIITHEPFRLVVDTIEKKSLVGLALNFKNNNEFLERQVPISKFSLNNNPVVGFLRRVSGLPSLPAGEYGFCGNKGSQPVNGGHTKWFSGGAFAAKRDLLYKNFNFKLFDIYENKVGKGEDGILGFTLSTHGQVEFLNKTLFNHNDTKDSTYAKDLFSFSKRVSYSRCYLSIEYARLTKQSKLKAFVVYNWFIFGRLVGLMINQLINYSPDRNSVIKGYLSGWFECLKDKKSLVSQKTIVNWKEMAAKDATN